MLTLLKIQNLALVTQVIWEPGPHLTSITGETGAGKSVIVGALRLILGERADKGIIRTGETTCSVEALFEVEKLDEINALLKNSGLPECEDHQLIIRRLITSSSNKQFVNNSPATLAFLKLLGEQLVDMNSPGEQMILLSNERQGEMLDIHGNLLDQRQKYKNQWLQWQSSCKEYARIASLERASEAEIQLLTHQVDEISSAELSSSEEIEIEEKWRRSQNSARLAEVISKSLSLLTNEETSILSLFNELQRLTHDLERLDPSLVEILSPITSIKSELVELEANLSDYSLTLSLNPAEQIALENRLNTIESLKRKYGHSVEAILEHLTTTQEKLNSIEHRGELLESLHTQIEHDYAKLKEEGANLSYLRQQAAPYLSEKIKEQLMDLGFKQAAFSIDLIPFNEAQPSGFEKCEFTISPNPGEPLKPLRIIASSGEMARIMLAVKTALADHDSIPLLVFDEIDANIGGEIACAVGEKMASLGKRHQVISITHFPQVAALSNHHFVVEKKVEQGRSFSQIIEVSGKERIKEIMRMLGSDNEAAKAHATNLLKNNLR